MSFLELLLIAVGLSMDAFAVSICKGLSTGGSQKRNALIIGVFFGGFQGFMPLIGWGLGTGFAPYITPWDHWIAFILLAIIGGRMVWGALHPDKEESSCEILKWKEVVLLAVATSIDALAVGITFAFLQVSILPAVSMIALVTFGLSFMGVFIGNRCGSSLGKRAELVGGIVLVLIGLKILLEHLGVIG